jgi:hypothetical protein
MELLNALETLWLENPALVFISGFLIFIGAVAKWKLFVKCDQPGYAAIIPIYDILVTLRIVGRPDSHIFFLLVPLYNIYFAIKLMIEVVQSFGKFNGFDYAFGVIFNIFYMLNLGLAYNEEYAGPVYKKDLSELKARKAQLA